MSTNADLHKRRIAAIPRGVGNSLAVYADRAQNSELWDVEGRRYLDAISSLWVTTLGHRVPELDAAVRDQLDKVAHSTMLGNGNRATVELTEALVPHLPVDDPHVLYASDGAAAVEILGRLSVRADAPILVATRLTPAWMNAWRPSASRCSAASCSAATRAAASATDGVPTSSATRPEGRTSVL